MFEDAFSFRGRLGRLRFFIDSLALGGLCLVFAVLIAFFVFPARSDGLSLVAFFIGMALCLPIVIWLSLSLYVRRIRDIGWDPLVVILGWVALGVLDFVVARLVPALAAPGNHGTIVGGLLNLALTLAIFFWPGSDNEDGGVPRPVERMTRMEGLGLAQAATPLPRNVPPRQSRPQGFGRRGPA
jgi:uncharacterized membrane protein YhaH (DUF805 family)